MNQDIINEVVKTERTRENVRKAFPYLVQLAQNHRLAQYKDLINALGYSRYSGIGLVLGYVADVTFRLSQITGLDIPYLNALVVNNSGVPSDGLDYVFNDYSSAENKKCYIQSIIDKAFCFSKWNWVLKELGLKPAAISSNEYAEQLRQSIKSYGFGGGEGAEHKAMKEAICNNPSLVRCKNVEYKETEHVLYSADRLDVFFILKNGDHIAVEVKPSTAPEDDIIRGIFQCVKYKAVMDAERTIEASNHNNATLLVIGGPMPAQAKRIANDLKVSYIEKFKV